MAAKKAIPRLKISERSKPWWTDEIQRLRSEKSALLRRAKRQKTPDKDLWQQWKVARNAYFKAIREAKQESWLQWLEAAKDSDIYRAYRAIGGSRTAKVPNIYYGNPETPEIAITFSEKYRAFLTTLFPTRDDSGTEDTATAYATAHGYNARITAIAPERPSLVRFVGQHMQ